MAKLSAPPRRRGGVDGFSALFPVIPKKELPAKIKIRQECHAIDLDSLLIVPSQMPLRTTVSAVARCSEPRKESARGIPETSKLSPRLSRGPVVAQERASDPDVVLWDSCALALGVNSYNS